MAPVMTGPLQGFCLSNISAMGALNAIDLSKEAEVVLKEAFYVGQKESERVLVSNVIACLEAERRMGRPCAAQALRPVLEEEQFSTECFDLLVSDASVELRLWLCRMIMQGGLASINAERFLALWGSLSDSQVAEFHETSGSPEPARDLNLMTPFAITSKEEYDRFVAEQGTRWSHFKHGHTEGIELYAQQLSQMLIEKFDATGSTWRDLMILKSQIVVVPSCARRLCDLIIEHLAAHFKVGVQDIAAADVVYESRTIDNYSAAATIDQRLSILRRRGLALRNVNIARLYACKHIMFVDDCINTGVIYQTVQEMLQRKFAIDLRRCWGVFVLAMAGTPADWEGKLVTVGFHPDKERWLEKIAEALEGIYRPTPGKKPQWQLVQRFLRFMSKELTEDTKADVNTMPDGKGEGGGLNNENDLNNNEDLALNKDSVTRTSRTDRVAAMLPLEHRAEILRAAARDVKLEGLHRHYPQAYEALLSSAAAAAAAAAASAR